MTKVFSRLLDKEVENDSEEWRHECECLSLLSKHPTKSMKHLWLYGVVDRNRVITRAKGKEELIDNIRSVIADPKKPPIAVRRGLETADRILADAKRLHELLKQG